MPFIVVTGSFHCLNYSPDGDTVRFQPDKLETLRALSGRPAKLNARQHASLRLEGIDALETHYAGRHQPRALADAATDRMLEHLGITDVTWDSQRSTVISASDATQGYILARSTDKYQRVIAFAFPGQPPDADGSSVFVKPDDLDASVNVTLLAAGLVYPTFYWSLFADLRDHMSGITETARSSKAGIHEADVTVSGAVVDSMKSLTDDNIIMPKLFRRASEYLSSAGTITGLKVALEMSREPVFDLRCANFSHFDTFLTEEQTAIALTRRPEELVFDPMPQRPAGAFAAMLEHALPMV